MLKKLALLLGLVAAAVAAAHLAFRPPSLEGRRASSAVSAAASTPLGRIALTPPPTGAGNTGVLPLIDGPDAFAARVALVRAAEVQLDVQYYIWQRDATGLILLDELRRAALRGVRIRLLLDDNGIAGLDADLAALDALPTVEIRLFNPFIMRKLKPLGYVFDFFRLNRRMHNKSLTADGAMSVVGGRNIGDIYFAFGEGVHYLDTDVIVTGDAAAEVGSEFDRYWASRSAYPADRILAAPSRNSLDTLIEDSTAAAASKEGQLYAERLRQSNLVSRIEAGAVEFEWTRVTLIADDPAKGLGEAAVDDLLFPQLMALLERPGSSVDLVSAYFVPGRRFTDTLVKLAGSGTRVRILTNSHNATDVIVVHSAYVKYRPDLLSSGVSLYELKPAFSMREEEQPPGPTGSSRASLHSKTLAVDGKRIFIGSFNFDPRSVFLNTEMGVLIESSHLAEGLAAAFDKTFEVASYRPKLAQDGSVVWDEVTATGERIRHEEEPGSTRVSRMALSILGMLPIEWLL